MTEEHDGVLRGLRVLDIGTMIAGPFCGTLLADHGADVIKIEHPAHGDPMRSWNPEKDGISLWWKVIARNKRFITLDLSASEGQQVFLELARTADVIVENFRPGTLEKWGLGYDVLSEIRPDIVLVRVSGYGQDGPYRERPGYGTIAEAMTGIPAFTGFPENPPQLSAFPLADYVAAVFGAFGAMSAIYRRGQTGVGEEVDVSLFEPLFRLVEAQVIAYDQLGLVKQRSGNRIEEDSPRNAYRTRDGEYVAISASSPRTWERFAEAIGRSDLITDPRFANNTDRCANAEELDAIVADWHKERPLDEVMRIFENYDVVAGEVYDIERIFSDVQYRARRAIVEVADEDFGTVRMPGVVPKLSNYPGSLRHTGAAIGADNEDVYLGELVLGVSRYEELARRSVI